MIAPSRRSVVGALVVAAVAVAVAYGLIRVGPPGDARARRLDERRVDDLRGLARAVDLHWTRHGSLPAALDELSDPSAPDDSRRDPATVEPYEYRPLDMATFELCAAFATDWSRPAEVFWSHPVGRHCFALEAREVRREEDGEEGRPTSTRSTSDTEGDSR